MTKNELISDVQSAADNIGIDITKADTKRVIESVFDVVAKDLAKGAGTRLTIPGFGTFTVKHKAARQGRNPRTGKPIPIAARNAVQFKAAPALKDLVNS